MGARSLSIPELPDEMRTYPGTIRNREAEEEAYRTEGPLPPWTYVHVDAMSFWQKLMWRFYLPLYPRWARSAALVENAPVRADGVSPPEKVDPAELTKSVKDHAATIGLAAVGVTMIDPLVTFAVPEVKTFQPLISAAPREVPEETELRAVVCIVEQNWKAMQTIPSLQFEKSHYLAVIKVRELAQNLANFLKERGHSAWVETAHSANIAMAVEAGLGQMGLNGMLLTPFAGGRLRMGLVITDAPLLLDSPVDYGVPPICDACKLCVRNCPTGAISSVRKEHRGVYKAKIKPERCLPVVTQVDGCSICHKVCPIQRYGLPAVLEEFKATGEVLGKGTDELEGYYWPLDGRYYGAGEKPPRAFEELSATADFVFDPSRKHLPLVSVTDDPSPMDKEAAPLMGE